MSAGSTFQAPLGIIVRSPPYQGRAGREQLDVALSAAVLEWPLELYFLGTGLGQLYIDIQPESAQLSKGLKAWASLPELTETRVFINQQQWSALGGRALVLDVEPLSQQDMVLRWRSCQHLLNL